MRAYLRFRGIDFEDIEVNALTKAELKSVVPGYKKVPVVIVKDQNDNTEAGIDQKMKINLIISYDDFL